MVRRAVEVAPTSLGVQADLGALPFRRGSLAAGWARNTYVHLRQDEVPMAFNDLHHVLEPGAPIEVTVFDGEAEGYEVFPDDDLPGRWFSMWTEDRLRDVLHGAGFAVDELTNDAHRDPTFTIRARRAHTSARLRRRRDASAGQRSQPERARGRRRGGLRDARQPLLASRARGGARLARTATLAMPSATTAWG